LLQANYVMWCRLIWALCNSLIRIRYNRRLKSCVWSV